MSQQIAGLTLLLEYLYLYLYNSCLFFNTTRPSWLTTFTYKHITLTIKLTGYLKCVKEAVLCKSPYFPYTKRWTLIENTRTSSSQSFWLKLWPFTRLFRRLLWNSRIHLRSNGRFCRPCRLVLSLAARGWVISWLGTSVEEGLVLVPEACWAPGGRNVQGSHRCRRRKLVSGGTTAPSWWTCCFGYYTMMLHVPLWINTIKNHV